MYLDAYAVRMVALATLGTGQQTPLCTQTEASTHHTHVLEKNTSLVTSFDKRRTFVPLVFHQQVQFSLVCSKIPLTFQPLKE